MGLYDNWKTENDRDHEDPRGVSDRSRSEPLRHWRCVVCGTRFDLGPATTHAQQTGHHFTYHGQPVDMLMPVRDGAA